MVNVGIGEYAISKNRKDQIVTHALGSCVALIVYSPETKYTAMAHIVLPEVINGQKRRSDSQPSYYASEIVPELLEFFISSIQCEPQLIEVSIVGGAEAINKEDVFQVGQRNVQQILSILLVYGIVPKSIDVGGNVSRTVWVDINDGSIRVKEHTMII